MISISAARRPRPVPNMMAVAGREAVCCLIHSAVCLIACNIVINDLGE